MAKESIITLSLARIMIFDVLKTNCNVKRWPQFNQPEGYNELGKQTLNMLGCFFLIQHAKKCGIRVDETRIPYIALKRLVEKTINGDIRDDNIYNILAEGKISKRKFDSLYESKILGKMSSLSKELLEVDDNWIETQIYKIATKLATLVEAKEISPNDSEKEMEILSQISAYRESCPELVAIALDTSGPEYSVIKAIAQLRGNIRWLKETRGAECNVLEHNGETAILAWMLSKELEPNDEIQATKLFWAGLFHDFPERWTGDMSSKVKDAVPGLREATEMYEDFCMEKYVYSILPEFEVSAIRHVMEDAGKRYRKMVKDADYLSAAKECFRNIEGGSRDEYFFGVIKDTYDSRDSYSPIFAESIELIYKETLAIYYDWLKILPRVWNIDSKILSRCIEKSINKFCEDNKDCISDTREIEWFTKFICEDLLKS